MEIFPNWTVIPVVLLLLTLIFVLRRTFFIPISRVLEERSRRIEGAKIEAEQIRRASQERLSDFDRKMRDARRESDQHMAAITNEAVGEKNRIVSEKRSEVESMLKKAKDDLSNQTEQARSKLRDEADDIASRIASQILKRPVGGKKTA
jgi:F-type H+-transporting ATPase subunit b